MIYTNFYISSVIFAPHELQKKKKKKKPYAENIMQITIDMQIYIILI